MSFHNPPPLDWTYSRLTGKVVFITGAGSGIGAAAARLLAKEGAIVAAAGRRKEKLTGLVEELTSAGHEALAVECDVTDEKSIENALQQIIDKYGRLDCAFNNAGVGSTWKTLHENSAAEFDNMMTTNLRGVFLCMKHEIPWMLKTSKAGAIVNTSSIGGLVSNKTNSLYAASKAGMQALTKCAALDYADKGLRINAIAPGPTRSEMFDDWLPTEEAKATIAKLMPMNYVAEPDDVARAVLFLFSDESRWTTGHVLPIDGGRSA